MPEKVPFSRHYLISSFLDSKTGLPVSGTLRPLKHRYFTFKTPAGVSMVGTDDRGLTMSVDRSFKQLKVVSLPAAKPWDVNFAPPGLLRQAYLALGEDWQAQLLKLLQQNNFAHPLKTLPAKFVRQDLHPEELELDDIKAHFQAGETYQAQVVPCVRLLSFLVQSTVLQTPPAKLVAHRVDDPETTIILSKAPKPTSLQIGRSKSAQFISYSASGHSLKPGTYVVECPASAVAANLRRRIDAGATIKRAFEVTFSLNNLFGEFDFHVFDLPSVEAALLVDFAERYPHILLPEDTGDSAKPSSPEFAAAASATARFKATFALAHEKQKLVIGALNADLSDTAKKIVVAALESASESALGENDQKGVRAVLSLYTIYETGKDTAEKWKKLKVAREQAKALGLIDKMVDGNLLRRLFLRTKWRDEVIGAVEAASSGATGKVLGNYVLHFKDKIDPLTLKALVKSSVASRQTTLDKLLASKKPTKALSALDTAVTLEQTISLWTELWDKAGDARVSNERLAEGSRSYAKKFWKAPCLPAVERMVALRKLADADELAYDAKQKEALKSTLMLSLKVAAHVPVAGEFAQIALVSIETWDAICTVATELDKLVDSHLFRHRSASARNKETAQLHGVQCEAIEQRRSSKPDTDPYVQLRLRTIVLIGLLRLIERCGTRLPKDEDFARKVGQYRIRDYIETFITSGQSVSIPTISGTPLDELWLYAAGNKNEKWADAIYEEDAGHMRPARWSTGVADVLRHLNFQRFFPIHGLESKDALELARAFSLNFAGIIDHALCYTGVFVRRKADEPWTPVDQAKFAITPITHVRVCAIFKSKTDLTGTPVSLQLLRHLMLHLATEGPLYKSTLERTTVAADAAAGAKMYLPNTAEAQYGSDPNAYACIFFPFYHFHGRTIQGLKPFGSLSVSDCSSLEYKFRLKVGDDEKVINIGDKAKMVKVEIPMQVPMFVDMILDKDFQANRTHEPKYGNLVLLNDNRDKAGIAGAFVRFGDAPLWKVAVDRAPNGAIFVNDISTDAQGDKRTAPYKWGTPLEMIVVAYARNINQRTGWSRDQIRCPAWLQSAQEKGGWEGTVRKVANAYPLGPSYSVELLSVALDKPQSQFAASDLASRLASPNLMGNKKPTLRALEKGVFTAPFPAYWFLARIYFLYQVEETEGQIVPVEGLRPFANDFPTASTQTYLFSIETPPPLGFDTDADLAIATAPIPRDLWRGTSFFDRPEFLSDDKLRRILSIEKARLKK